MIQLNHPFEMENFHRFGEDTCGVFFKVLKDRKAAQCQLALGFWWDSRTLTRCLVQEKVDAYMFAFGEVLTCKSLSLLDMQQTAGKMQRAVMTFPRGAACLLVSMFALMCGLRLPWQRRRTTRTVRQDVATVIELLRLNLGKGYYSFKDFVVGPAMATDASRSRSYTGGGWFSFCGLYDFWVYGSRAARQRKLEKLVAYQAALRGDQTDQARGGGGSPSASGATPGAAGSGGQVEHRC